MAPRRTPMNPASAEQAARRARFRPKTGRRHRRPSLDFRCRCCRRRAIGQLASQAGPKGLRRFEGGRQQWIITRPPSSGQANKLGRRHRRQGKAARASILAHRFGWQQLSAAEASASIWQPKSGLEPEIREHESGQSNWIILHRVELRLTRMTLMDLLATLV